jgi:hypothetical protein
MIDCDANFRVNIRDFANMAKDAIKELFSMKQVEKKVKALAEGKVPFNELEELKSFDEFELFGVINTRL